MRDIKTIVMMGKPGSGKSTQAELIAEKLGYKPFSAGRVFRALAERPTFVGRKVKSIIDAGHLMPHWFASYLFEREIIEHENDEGIVFEGIARTEPEAVFFEDVMGFFERDYVVFNIDLTDDIATARLLGRAERKDDAADVIPERLREYEAHTHPAIEYFRSKGRVVDVSGVPSPEEIHCSIMSEFESLTS